MISRSRSGPTAAPTSTEGTTSATRTVNCSYSARAPCSATVRRSHHRIATRAARCHTRCTRLCRHLILRRYQFSGGTRFTSIGRRRFPEEARSGGDPPTGRTSGVSGRVLSMRNVAAAPQAAFCGCFRCCGSLVSGAVMFLSSTSRALSVCGRNAPMRRGLVLWLLDDEVLRSVIEATAADVLPVQWGRLVRGVASPRSGGRCRGWLCSWRWRCRCGWAS